MSKLKELSLEQELALEICLKTNNSMVDSIHEACALLNFKKDNSKKSNSIVVFCADLGDETTSVAFFDSEKDFCNRYGDMELDYEGFVGELWYSKMVRAEGCLYHLVKSEE